MSILVSGRIKTAQDVTPKTQNWTDKLSSVAGDATDSLKYLSQFLPGVQGKLSTGSPVISKPGSSSVSMVTHPHCFRLQKIGDYVWVLLASVDSFSVWRSDTTSKTGYHQTELVLTGSEKSILDGYVSVDSESGIIFVYILADTSDNVESRSFALRKWQVSSVSTELTSQCCSAGEACSMLTLSNKIVVVNLIGGVKLFHQKNFEVVLDIPSIVGIPTVSAGSDRWIAIQIPQQYQNAHGFQSNSTDLGQAARKLVSSVYNLGKVGWDTLGPLVYKAYGTKDEPIHTSNSTEEKVEPVLGGAVAILDFSTVQSISSVAGEITLQVVCKFVAHEERLEVMTFSPSGLLLASASQSGQVVHIHSLCSAGLLFSSAAKGIIFHNRRPRYEQTPQLVHKLVRGLTLSRVLNISFDHLESCVAISTTNGTVHVFELDRQNISINSNSAHPHLNNVGSSKPTSVDHSSSPLENQGFSSDDHVPGTSAGSSWASSAPLSNIDDLISQLTSQQAVNDASDYLRSKDSNSFHFKQSYSSQKIRLPLHSHLVSTVSDLNNTSTSYETTKIETANPRIDALSTWAYSSGTSNSGFFSISSVLVYAGSKYKISKVDSDHLTLYAISSQGFLSRFRLSAGVVTISNGLRLGTGNSGSSSSGSVIASGSGNALPTELNRWDLLAAPVEDSPNSLSSSPNDATSFLSSAPIKTAGGNGNSHGNNKTDFAALRGISSTYIMKKNAVSGTFPSSTSWLPLFGDAHSGNSNVEPPLWTRPQVSFRVRIKQSSSYPMREKDKQTSHKDGNSEDLIRPSSNFSFLFPERTPTIAVGPIRPQHLSKSIYQNNDLDLDDTATTRSSFSDKSITSLISSAIKTELMSSGVTPDQKSGRHVATKHGLRGSTLIDSSRAIPDDVDEDWQIPSNVEWEDSS